MSTRVLAFESRRGAELTTLLNNLGWQPTVVPVFAEAPEEDPAEALEFGVDLLAGRYQQAIFLTGVGVRHLAKVVGPQTLTSALPNLVTIPRGPKPAAALRDLGVTPTILIREPATWREILAALANEPRRETAVIEYGRRDTRLLAGLTDLGIRHQSVAVYHYAFPEDLSAVGAVLDRLAANSFDVVVFTASVQYMFLAAAAERLGHDEAWKDGLKRAYIASIGPTMSETLEADEIPVHFVPTSSKMGILIHELGKARANL